MPKRPTPTLPQISAQLDATHVELTKLMNRTLDQLEALQLVRDADDVAQANRTVAIGQVSAMVDALTVALVNVTAALASLGQ